MPSGPIILWQINEETMETVTDYIFLGSKITADGDCSHEIKRCFLSNGVKVVPAFVTPEDKEAAEESFRNLQAEKDNLANQVTELTAQVETLKKTPAAKSAHESFESCAIQAGKTGNKGLDRIAEVMAAK